MLPIKSTAVLIAAGCVALGTVAHAQDANDSAKDANSLDVTMTLLPEGAKLPDAVTRTITLPPAAPSHAASSARLGTANANRARRENGLKTAEQARTEGRDFGQAMRQQAAEQRENAERGKGPDNGGAPDRGGNPGSTPPDHANPPPGTSPASTPPSSTPPPSSAHTPPSH